MRGIMMFTGSNALIKNILFMGAVILIAMFLMKEFSPKPSSIQGIKTDYSNSKQSF